MAPAKQVGRMEKPLLERLQDLRANVVRAGPFSPGLLRLIDILMDEEEKRIYRVLCHCSSCIKLRDQTEATDQKEENG